MKFCQKVCNRYLLIVRKNQGDPKIFPGAIKIFPAAWLNPPPPPGGIGLKFFLQNYSLFQFEFF